MALSAASRIRWNGRKFRFDPSKPRWIEIAKLLARVAGLFSDIALAMVSLVSYPMLLTGRGFLIAYKRTSAPSDPKP